MDKPKHTGRLIIFTVPLGVAIVALLLLFKSLSAPLPTPAPPTPTPDPSREVVARIGEQRILFADWAVTFYLDALMSRLSGQPIPAPAETLERMINDALVLPVAAETGITATETDVEARIALLLATWGLDEDQIVAELAAIGLNRETWAEAIAHLYTVERFLAEVIWAGVPAGGQDAALSDWLQTHRAQVRVEVDTRGLQPVLPTPMPIAASTPPASQSVSTSPLPSPPPAPTATPSPLPTFTATPISVSPLPVPSATTGPPQMGQHAPDFALPDTNGQVIALGDYQAQQKVVIIFFRTSG